MINAEMTMAATEHDFQEIYETYQPGIYRYLCRMIGEAEAEDLTQEVFIKVSQSIGDFRNESQLSTWIYRIAANTAIDRLRSASFRADVNSVDIDCSTGDYREHAVGDLLDKSLIRKEMNKCIGDLIDKLPEDYRTVISLSEIGGFPNREIVDILGVSIDTVKIRLHRARKQLKGLMKTNCSLYRDERNELACDKKTNTLKFR
jgi:RNA polymerase sigma-70 factor (ECF subfamily)